MKGTHIIKMPRLTFPAKAKVFAIWVRRRRGATLLARVIILSFARISQKRCCDSLDFRENPTFAAFPAALCSVFSLRRYVTALLFFNRRIHSFRVCLSAYWGQKRKLRFPFLQEIIFVHTFCFELTKQKVVILRTTPTRVVFQTPQRSEFSSPRNISAYTYY